MPISHCLLALSGQTIESIARVRSHPAALAQCQAFLAKHPGITAVPWYDTAGAARDLAETPEANTAVIASEHAAERYGLTILMVDVQDHADNETSFVMVRRANEHLESDS